jgi:bifunctional aspartokinase / homoserine dehydrogenase 1
MGPESLQNDLIAHDQSSVHGTPSALDSVTALKFGGSSLLGADRMLHGASLVRDASEKGRVIVVVSAMKGVTDRLLSLASFLCQGRPLRAKKEAEAILDLHLDVFRELHLCEAFGDRVRHDIHLLGRDLSYEVRQPINSTASAELSDRLASFGERFSARLFAAALARSGVPAVPVCSSDFVLTCDTFRDAQPQLDLSRRRGREVLLPLLRGGIVPVVTGFIGATPDGRFTTLGRNSSDFSGAIIAHVVDAEELVIWTDVDGIFTANPNDSPEARLLHNLSYEEAQALAASGAKVIHPSVLPLAAETHMTVWIRNIFKPHVRGTRIGSRPGAAESSQDSDRLSQPGGAA